MERSRYQETPVLEKFSTGSLMVDLVTDGGFPIGRAINIVGDWSAGKSLLAIETCSAFARQYPDGIIRYVETESAFDPNYAALIGLPVERVQLESSLTVIEHIYKDFDNFINSFPKQRKLYIIDSLDAVSDLEELDRDIEKGSFGGSKPKLMGQFFRTLNSKSSSSLCTLIIVSQVRANIGVRFGDKQRRSGGAALDFYCSIVLWLNRTGNIKKTSNKLSRTIGITTKIKTKKNKVGAPYKEGILHINFAYGIDDEISCLEWIRKELKSDSIVLSGKEFQILPLETAIKKARNDKKYSLLMKLRNDIYTETKRLWEEVESRFKPPITKRDLMGAVADSDLKGLVVPAKGSKDEEEENTEDLSDAD